MPAPVPDHQAGEGSEGDGYACRVRRDGCECHGRTGVIERLHDPRLDVECIAPANIVRLLQPREQIERVLVQWPEPLGVRYPGVALWCGLVKWIL